MINQTSSGNGSPNIIGDRNKVNSKINLTQKIVYGGGGFIMGVITSLVGSWLYKLLVE
ncbi:hypothetical protein [uncultured Phocaeicola sp.]|jgi:Na+/melibiose symporter-like transporter|uniref:hypothetical protein n=1 Tax=uncultured Phocaeicola sp. TaxID=990718 RepID=UPI0025A1E4B0|nr:hypothetical protein [uncultured Phocaeicola sp.]